MNSLKQKDTSRSFTLRQVNVGDCVKVAGAQREDGPGSLQRLLASPTARRETVGGVRSQDLPGASLLRVGERVSRQPHKLKTACATRAPATVYEKKQNIRSLSKAPQAIPPRGVSLNALALALCAFFIFAALASCIASHGREGDSTVPRELR